MSNLKDLDWFDGGDEYGDLEAHSPSHAYIIKEWGGKYVVFYMRFGSTAKQSEPLVLPQSTKLKHGLGITTTRR